MAGTAGWSIGFVEAPFAVVRDRLIAWRLTLGADLTERRGRDRFTRPMLVGYLAGLGIAVDDHAAYGRTTPIRQNVSWPTRRETLRQARITRKIDPPR